MRNVHRKRVVVFCLVLSGCAIQTPHLAISQWPISQKASYYHEALPYRLIVTPFLDQRPDRERHGQRPAGVFLLLWNRRVGDYYTADHIFGGEIGAQLAQQVATYLGSANVFSQVEYVPSSAKNTDALQRLGREQAADYVLGGEVQHFFGSQHQHFSMFALPLYFISTFGWQESKSLPWGQTTIRCTLYDGRSGDLLWRHTIEASETLPRETDSMAEAAMYSFTEAAGQLAAELRQLPLETFQHRAVEAQPSGGEP